MIANHIREKMQSGSWIRDMFEKGAELKKIYGDDMVFDLTLGNPDVPAPDEVNRAIIARASMGNNIHGYMSNAGYPEIRSLIADMEAKRSGVPVTMENVTMCVGAAGGLNCVFKAILNPGDEVLVQAPYFVQYGGYVDNHGGKLKVVPAKLPDFDLDPQLIGSYITPKTKAVIINSPNNPTGVVYSRETLEALEQVLTAKEKEFGTDIYLVSDEPYREIVYDGVEVPPVMSIFHNAIVVYSYSKSLSLAGERIGYVAVSPNCSDVEALSAAIPYATRELGYTNAPGLFQYILKDCINCQTDVDAYKVRRDILMQGLQELGYEFPVPQGAFYIFMKTPTEDENEFINNYCLPRNVLAV
ncbi:MAG: pyridoxal phosphate-dependent aminotransferase, partial [Clostridia bacterium]|nr:pyridoxal phosphate-dependent aminotransferase [Clostridia bacterium]